MLMIFKGIFCKLLKLSTNRKEYIYFKLFRITEASLGLYFLEHLRFNLVTGYKEQNFAK